MRKEDVRSRETIQDYRKRKSRECSNDAAFRLLSSLLFAKVSLTLARLSDIPLSWGGKKCIQWSRPFSLSTRPEVRNKDENSVGFFLFFFLVQVLYS